MKENNAPPSLFSPTFHLKFFPRIILRHILPSKDHIEVSNRGTSFSSITEHMVLLTISIISCIVGLTSALNKGSLIGWLFACAGACGVLFLFVTSIASKWREKPSYDEFRFFTFIFLLMLGFAGGLSLGHTLHAPYVVRVLCGIAGIFLGYFIGILGGLWIQCLGWMGSVLDYLASLGAISLVILDIILLL